MSLEKMQAFETFADGPLQTPNDLLLSCQRMCSCLQGPVGIPNGFWLFCIWYSVQATACFGASCTPPRSCSSLPFMKSLAPFTNSCNPRQRFRCTFVASAISTCGLMLPSTQKVFRWISIWADLNLGFGLISLWHPRHLDEGWISV